jgi:hypothetical protein
MKKNLIKSAAVCLLDKRLYSKTYATPELAGTLRACFVTVLNPGRDRIHYSFAPDYTSPESSCISTPSSLALLARGWEKSFGVARPYLIGRIAVTLLGANYPSTYLGATQQPGDVCDTFTITQ